MKRVVILTVIGALALMLHPTLGQAAEMGVTDSRAINNASLTRDPAEVFNGCKHVANGIALRNEARGTISLRGIPLGSNVVKAYLYWNLSNGVATGSSSDVAWLNGNRLVGTKRSDAADPCWGMAGNHTYRAIATSFLPKTRPNCDYEVLVDSAVSTSGQNPSSPSESQTTRLEGATLIVIYSSANTSNNKVFLYDTWNASMFSGTGTFVLNHSLLSGSGLFTMSGADGQRGVGNAYTNGASNETGKFNGAQFSGPPVASSDWDGSAGWPLPQLWDVHTHQVTLSGTSSTVVYAAGADCLVPVVFVLQAGL
jgi:hypothetical protein